MQYPQQDHERKQMKPVKLDTFPRSLGVSPVTPRVHVGTRKTLAGHVDLLVNGAVVGRVLTLKSRPLKSRFYLILDGVRWNPDATIVGGGTEGTGFKRLKDAVAVAGETLAKFMFPKPPPAKIQMPIMSPLDVLKPMLGEHATSGISWNGFNVVGSKESIAEVRRLVEFEAARKLKGFD